jgi:hypothetical protein
VLSFRFLPALLLAAGSAAQNPETKPAAAPPPSGAAAARPVARLGAAAQRNENVVVYLIDTNAAKEANIRVGTRTTVVDEFSPESQYFAAEHGRAPSDRLLMRPAAPASGWRGEAGFQHQNSVFNARTFFQVGAVKPSHRNFYNGRLTGPVPRLGALTASFVQRDIRGMVNGNVLVPLASERTPLATDPATRAVVQRFLNAYPNEAPNRLDFDPRALNTNSPQRIDDISGTLRWDVTLGSRDKLALMDGIDRQHILAFQFVAGQNPNTTIHNHQARIAWFHAISSTAELQVAASFARNRSLLEPEPNAVGPRVRYGYSLEELGPDSYFPVNRATSTFRYGAAVQGQAGGGRRQWHVGGDWTRLRLNGEETYNSRGQVVFGSGWGRNAIDNLRWGTALNYEVAIGNLSRGYRNWTANLFAADKWNVHSRLTVSYGLRYMLDSRPVEIRRREIIPYHADANNFSPRLALAWRAGRGWVVRAAYVTSFSQILPVTYQQIRLNPPGVLYVMVADPYLPDPLRGVDISPTGRYSPTWLSPDLATPYSHQYSASFERRTVLGSLLRLNYIGSRSFKLVTAYTMNRAEPTPGIPLTTATVNLRRPDPRYYDTKSIVNGGIAYFDAAQANWDLPVWRGLGASVSYTFSKAIDEGMDYTATAAYRDVTNFRSQWQYDSLKDKKGPSNFDSTHALLFSYIYELPAARRAPAWLRAAASRWQVSGSNMWKKGTPLTLYVGSDSPGYGNVDGGGSDRPNIVDPSILGMTVGHPDTATSIISRSRFAYLSPGQHAGSLGRGTFRKAPIWNWNAAVARQFRLPNEWSAQLRGEVLNLSNTPQFDEPQRNLTSPAFGKITNTLNDGRVFQFAFRLMF